MRLTAKVSLFLAFLYVVSSSVLESAELRDCKFDEFLLMKHNCFASIYKYIADEFETESHQGRETLAEHAIKCLNERNCREASALKLSIQEKLDPPQNPNTDQVLCLKAFFRSAYNSHESNVYHCLRDYDFLDYNSTKRREGYTNGKSCLIDFMNDNCTPAASKYFVEKYQLLSNMCFLESCSPALEILRDFDKKCMDNQLQYFD